MQRRENEAETEVAEGKGKQLIQRKDIPALIKQAQEAKMRKKNVKENSFLKAYKTLDYNKCLFPFSCMFFSSLFSFFSLMTINKNLFSWH